MKTFKMRIPIRVRIVGLIAVALALSLLLYNFAGTALIVKDKTSYIFELSLSQAREASSQIESRLGRITSIAMILALSREPSWKDFEKEARELGISEILILRPKDERSFEYSVELGDKPARLKEVLLRQGWTPAVFGKSGILVGALQEGLLPIGGRLPETAGQSVAFITLFSPASLRLESQAPQTEILDSLGQIVISLGSGPAADRLPPEQVLEAAGSIPRDLNTGARELPGAIMSYQRAMSGQLMVLGFVPRKVAFAAADALAQRSAVLGGSILLVAIALTLVLVKQMTRKLQQMYVATERVAQGDFTVRVDERSRIEDEVTGLARSFNMMADKINELMAQTAEKARMEKELETAQEVQSRFFPTKNFESAQFRLSGKYVPASECAGDWWHYAKVNEDQLLVVVGDVTGHGVSAALVTAAVHSGFFLALKQIEGTELPPEMIVKWMMDELNLACFVAANGSATITLLATCIDLKTGKMTISNGAHPPIYVVSSGAMNLKPVYGGRCTALGSEPEIRVETATHQLKPGDMLLWYTDGMGDQRVSDGKKIPRAAMAKIIKRIVAEKAPDAEAACNALMKEVLDFFGQQSNRPDDITMVMGAIPASARFVSDTSMTP